MTSCNLIVNYLPADLDEIELKQLFQEHGNVTSVKLLGASMCYGFVVMEQPEQAKVAVSALNSKSLRGKILRVGLAKQKEDLDNDTTNTNLYITGINESITEANLEQAFGKFGQIISSRVVKSKSTPNKAVAFVKFVTREEAEAAIEGTNGKLVCLRNCDEGTCQCSEVLSVKFSLSPSKAAARRSFSFPPGMPCHVAVPFAHPMAPTCFRTPYNHNFEVSTTLPNYGYATGHLQTFMHHNSTATQFSNAMAQQMHNFSNYYSTMGYQNPQFAQFQNASYPTPVPAIQTPAPAPLPVPPPSVSGITPGNLVQFASGSHCVFVYGLSQATTEEELLALFLPFGAISNCRVCYETTDGKRACKGYGFVNFYSYNDAHLAITSLNNFNYKGHTLQVRFKSNKEAS